MVNDPLGRFKKAIGFGDEEQREEDEVSIPNRIEQLRQTVGLSRKEFGQILGVSFRTLEGIEQRGNIPKSDILAKISEQWPEFSLWLLTGKSYPLKAQVTPRSYGKEGIHIIDSIDPRYLDNYMIKNEFFRAGEFVFIQNAEKKESLGGLFLLDESLRNYYTYPNKRYAIWLRSGYMNFDSTHGGRNVLRDFREQLQTLDKDLSLINSSIYVQLKSESFDELEKYLSIDLSFLEDVKFSDLKNRFEEWKGGGDYLWPTLNLD